MLLPTVMVEPSGRSTKPSRRSTKTFLSGFEVVFPASKGLERNLTLSLYHADMTRIGAILADAFCKALSGGDRYFEQEAGTATITEAA
jgi:hypothetical protein